MTLQGALKDFTYDRARKTGVCHLDSRNCTGGKWELGNSLYSPRSCCRASLWLTRLGWKMRNPSDPIVQRTHTPWCVAPSLGIRVVKTHPGAPGHPRRQGACRLLCCCFLPLISAQALVGLQIVIFHLHNHIKTPTCLYLIFFLAPGIYNLLSCVPALSLPGR